VHVNWQHGKQKTLLACPKHCNQACLHCEPGWKMIIAIIINTNDFLRPWKLLTYLELTTPLVLWQVSVGLAWQQEDEAGNPTCEKFFVFGTMPSCSNIWKSKPVKQQEGYLPQTVRTSALSWSTLSLGMGTWLTPGNVLLTHLLPCWIQSLLVKPPYERSYGDCQKILTPRKVTQGHCNRHGSVS